MADISVRFEFSGPVWVWRGPAPYYFVTVPEAESEELKDLMRLVTYGWGMIPVSMCLGKAQWKTALWPKEGAYIVPIKAKVREAESVGEGDTVTLRLEVGLDAP